MNDGQYTMTYNACACGGLVASWCNSHWCASVHWSELRSTINL